jgi:microfibrillar-associated protein 1
MSQCVHFKEVRFCNAMRNLRLYLIIPVGYYPNLLALYDHLGVEYREANFSYSFSHLEFDRIRTDRMALRPHLIYNGRSGRNGVGIPGRWLSDRDDYAHESSPKSQPSLRNNVRILTDPVTRVLSSLLAMLLIFCFFIRLNLLCIPMIWRHDSPETLREWTSRTTPTSAMARWTRLDDRWRAFVRDVVLPLFSAVCTAPEEDVYEHPINEILGESP